MDYRERHVVVTGGTGALGTAVVGALLEAGAVCHVPYRSEGEAKRFPHGDNKKVSLVALRDLADEAAVTDFYGGLDQLWASIHIAGGFAFAPIATSDKALLLSQSQRESGIGLSVQPGGGRRIRTHWRWRSHCQCRGAACVGATAWRKPHRLCGRESRRRGTYNGARGGDREGRCSGKRGRALHHGYTGQP